MQLLRYFVRNARENPHIIFQVEVFWILHTSLGLDDENHSWWEQRMFSPLL